MTRTTLVNRLPAALQRAATPERLRLATEFGRFGLVGVFGLAVDTATVYGTRHSLGIYGAGVVAYVLAASCNWLMNRVWTFKGRGARGRMHRQWALFMVTNLVGFALNRGTFVIMVTFLPAAEDQPVIATAAGAIAGLFINFTLNRRVVFR